MLQGTATAVRRPWRRRLHRSIAELRPRKHMYRATLCAAERRFYFKSASLSHLNPRREARLAAIRDRPAP